MEDKGMQPRLGEVAPALQCNRLTDGTFEQPVYCGREGKWHVIWTPDAQNGISCDECVGEIRAKWVYFGLHPYEPVCSIQGARYSPRDDRCVVDDGDLGLTAIEELTADA